MADAHHERLTRIRHDVASDPRDDASEPMIKPRVAPDALRRLEQELELHEEAPQRQKRSGGRGIWIGLWACLARMRGLLMRMGGMLFGKGMRGILLSLKIVKW